MKVNPAKSGDGAHYVSEDERKSSYRALSKPQDATLAAAEVL